jgi:hypothetical protein
MYHLYHHQLQIALFNGFYSLFFFIFCCFVVVVAVQFSHTFIASLTLLLLIAFGINPKKEIKVKTTTHKYVKEIFESETLNETDRVAYLKIIFSSIDERDRINKMRLSFMTNGERMNEI